MRRNARWLFPVVLLCALGGTDRAWARNFHISGGIQYVAQGDKEKAKGLFEDARRLYGKAVAQLVEGIAEDQDDIEAWDYLGRAYAELDSTERAGWAFGSGIRLACAQDEKKKLCKRMQDNRTFYWGTYYQSALDTWKLADAAATPEAQKDSARAAAAKMRKAIQVYSEEPSSYCNLAAFLGKAEDYAEALEAVQQGLQVAAGDSCLIRRQEDITVALAVQAEERGDYDAAIAQNEKILAADPSDVTTAGRLGQLYFNKGQKLEKDGDAAGAKAAYASAAKNFGLLHQKNETDEDALYNYALALIQAEDYSAAAAAVQKGLLAKPTSLDLHSLMANAYTGLKLDDEATKHRLVSMVVKEGTKVSDPGAFATASAQKWGPKSNAASELQKMGPPEEVYTQTRGDYDVELWCWWSKSRTLTLVKGATVSDLSFSQVAAPKSN